MGAGPCLHGYPTHATMAKPHEWVPGLHGGCRIEAIARHLPTPLARSAPGALQMARDGRIWQVPIGDALRTTHNPTNKGAFMKLQHAHLNFIYYILHSQHKHLNPMQYVFVNVCDHNPPP